MISCSVFQKNRIDFKITFNVRKIRHIEVQKLWSDKTILVNYYLSELICLNKNVDVVKKIFVRNNFQFSQKTIKQNIYAFEQKMRNSSVSKHFTRNTQALKSLASLRYIFLKKLILLFSKDATYKSKVCIKIFVMLQKFSIKKRLFFWNFSQKYFLYAVQLFSKFTINKTIFHNITVLLYFLNQINSALMSIRNFFQNIKKILPTPYFWTVVYI